ncbi:MAG: hypothetical protein JSS82_13855 [Bacteroidetes bacterium]|nr:hypothetical protein [Bacteroidota bacterium]
MRSGYLAEHQEQRGEKSDQLFSEDNKNSMQVDKGILENKKTSELKDDKGIAYSTIDQYSSTNTGQMKNMFEFVAKNSDVEWQLWNLGEGGLLPSSYLTTSHNENASANNFEPIFFLGLTSHTHSHPGGNDAPSGSQVPLDMPELRTQGDIGFIRSVNSYITKTVNENNVRSNLFNTLKMDLKLPRFFIFTPDGKYREYNENTYTDMEVIIKGEKKK